MIDVIKQATKLEQQGLEDDALDLIYDRVNELLIDGKFHEFNDLLDNNMECDNIGTDVLVAILIFIANLKFHDKVKVPLYFDFRLRALSSLRLRGICNFELWGL